MLFFKNYAQSNFPEKMKKEKFQKVVNDFFNEYEDNIKEILIEDNIEKLNNFSVEIKETFKLIYKDLISFIKNLNCITIIQENKMLEELIKVGIHKPDNILINEAYSLSLSFYNNIIFITFDKNILRCSKEIDNLTSSSVHILNQRLLD